MTRTADRKLAVRSAVNDWIGRTFPDHRTLLVGEQPVRDGNIWSVGLVTKHNGTTSRPLCTVVVSDAATIVAEPDPDSVLGLLAAVSEPDPQPARRHVGGDGWALRQADGIAAAAALPASSVDLLLTDPPYGISRRYNCETQIPRAGVRPDGTDFTDEQSAVPTAAASSFLPVSASIDAHARSRGTVIPRLIPPPRCCDGRPCIQPLLRHSGI